MRFVAEQDAAAQLVNLERVVLRHENLPFRDAVRVVNSVAYLALLVVLDIRTDGALRAVHEQPVVARIRVLSEHHSDIERRPRAVCESDDAGRRKIHAEVGKLRSRLHVLRLRINQRKNHRRAVAAEVVHRSAAEFLMQPEILPVALRHECRVDVIDVADDAALHVLL